MTFPRNPITGDLPEQSKKLFRKATIYCNGADLMLKNRILCLMATLCLLTLIGCGESTPSVSSQNTATPTQNNTEEALKARIAEVIKKSESPENRAKYIASTKQIGSKNDAIYYKEFMKNPLKYKGVRVNVTGKIMNIEESNNKTFMQIYITRNYDAVVAVYYEGSIDVYEDDVVHIYGEALGTLEGQNRMGAQMSWPVIGAKYIKKRPDITE
jgi:hypothetical protein